MTLSIYEVGRRFQRGEKRGRSHATEIVDRPYNTLLVDYGWAVLAKRDKRTGDITYYDDWYGYSQSTSRHIRKLELPRSKFVENKAPQLSSWEDNDSYVEDFRNTYSGVFLDPFTGKWRMKKK